MKKDSDLMREMSKEGSDEIIRAIKAEANVIAAELKDRFQVSIRKARTPSDYLLFWSEVVKSADGLFDLKLKEAGDSIACKAGCFFCCYIKVDVSALEIFQLVDHLHKNFPSERIEEVRLKAQENRKRITALSADEQRGTNIACPLLKDGCCSCYEARPLACRRYHSVTIEPCEKMYDRVADKDRRMTVSEVHYTLPAVQAAANVSMEEQGLDGTWYDLSSALHEALSNPKCFKRWRDGKKAFPKDTVSKDEGKDEEP